MSINNFKHIYINNEKDRTIILFHGTGADEYDLLPFAKKVASDYNHLTLRGNVSENGMLRFFIRFDSGIFDEKSIKEEAIKLRDFLIAFAKKNQLEVDQLVYLGYSNGANMIIALLFLFPDMVKTAVLIHPMLPLQPDEISLKNKRLAISYGLNDQMITAQESKEAVSVLKKLGANLEVFSHPHGHGITQEEVEFVINFLKKSDVV